MFPVLYKGELMSAVFSPLSKEDIEKIAKAFDLGKVESSKGVSHGSVNTIYHLKTQRGGFYLRLEEIKEGPSLAQEFAFLEFIQKKGFPCPKPIKQKSFFLLPWKETFVTMAKEFPGEIRPLGAYKKEDFRKVGELIASLHELGRGFPNKISDRFDLESLEKLFCSVKSSLEEEFKKILLVLEQEIKVQKDQNQDRAQLPQGVVHGDVFSDNLFFNGNQLTGLIDFDSLATRELIYDLATAMNALCFQDQQFIWDRVQELLQGYEGIRKLQNKEKELMVSVCRLSSLRFTLTRIKDFHLRSAKSSGLIHRDFRDFFDRLEFQRKLSTKEFWNHF